MKMDIPALGLAALMIGAAGIAFAQGVDVNAKDDQGKTALMRAAQDGSLDRVKALIASHGDVKAKDNEGDTALMLASERGHADCIKALIAAKSDLNAKGYADNTALMDAAFCGYTDCVTALIGAHANVNAKNKDGKTALDLAGDTSHAEIVRALIAAGAIASTQVTRPDAPAINPPVKKPSVIRIQVPSSFSPISDLMTQMKQFSQVSSRTHCVLSSDSNGLWRLQIPSDGLVEESTCSGGIDDEGAPTFPMDPDTGRTFVVNGENVETHFLGAIMYHANGRVIVGIRGGSGDYGPILPPSNLPHYIGIGSVISFSSDSWVRLGNMQYRNGGFAVQKDGISFLDGTEVLYDQRTLTCDKHQWFEAVPVDTLIAMLKDADASVRLNALTTLIAFNDTWILDPLASVVSDTDMKVRSAAAFALADHNDHRAVDTLLAMLKDADAAVRLKAVNTLGSLADKRATQQIIVEISDPDTSVRSGAITSLGNLNDNTAVVPLLKVLHDPDSAIRGLAVSALGQLKAASAAKSLAFTLRVESNADVKSKILAALTQMTGKQFTTYTQWDTYLNPKKAVASH